LKAKWYALLVKYKEIPENEMGMPVNWKDESLWMD